MFISLDKLPSLISSVHCCSVKITCSKVKSSSSSTASASAKSSSLGSATVSVSLGVLSGIFCLAIVVVVNLLLSISGVCLEILHSALVVVSTS